jgi:hypothetical protein
MQYWIKYQNTTRFHSFTDENIPSVCDSDFVSNLFADVFTDGLSLLVISYSVAISVGNTKKSFADGFTDGICAPKKKFPAWNIPTDFIPSVILWFTDGYVPLINLSVNVWNIDRRYPSVNSSVNVSNADGLIPLVKPFVIVYSRFVFKKLFRIHNFINGNKNQLCKQNLY